MDGIRRITLIYNLVSSDCSFAIGLGVALSLSIRRNIGEFVAGLGVK